MADGIRRIACDWKYVKYMREAEDALIADPSDADLLWLYVSSLDWPDIVRVLDIVRLSGGTTDAYTGMRVAGVPHAYIAGFPKPFIASGQNAGHIIEMYRSRIPVRYASAFADSLCEAGTVHQLHNAGVPSDYALDCFAAGLDVGRVIDAHAAGIPLEYVTA